MGNTERPRIKLKMSSIDWTAEIIAFAFLVILISLPLVYLNELPETIPVHFNGAGVPDGYGSRSSLWLLPLIGMSIYLMMTILSAFPHIYNYPVKITPENAIVQYRLASRLMRILKTLILVIFSFISYKTIKTATGNAEGLGKAFLPVFLLITFGIIIVFVVRSLNNQQSK
jgi:uncharacterized membrane protein